MMQFQWPIDKQYRYVSGYDYTPPNHAAQDFGTPNGANYYAPQDGIIKTARFTLPPNTTGQKYGYGNYIEIDHGDGWITLAAHLMEGYVKVGDKVKMGQLIAKCDNTGWSSGPHLHFAIKHNGSSVNPTDYLYDYVEPTPEPEPEPMPEFPALPIAVVLVDKLRVRIAPSTSSYATTLFYVNKGNELEVKRIVQTGMDKWAEVGYKEFVAFDVGNYKYLKWKE